METSYKHAAQKKVQRLRTPGLEREPAAMAQLEAVLTDLRAEVAALQKVVGTLVRASGCKDGRLQVPVGVDTETGKKIAALLKEDPTMPVVEIATRVGVTRQRVYQILRLGKRVDKGRVYALKGNGKVKFGFTSRDVATRIQPMQSSVPFPVHVLANAPGDRQLEREIRDACTEHRIRGEWFEPTGVVLEWVERLKELEAAEARKAAS